MSREFWVRVPSSTSNLGPGFDVLGLALDRFLELRFRPGGEGFTIRREGTLAEEELQASEDLVLQAMLEAGGSNPNGRNALADAASGAL